LIETVKAAQRVPTRERPLSAQQQTRNHGTGEYESNLLDDEPESSTRAQNVIVLWSATSQGCGIHPVYERVTLAPHLTDLFLIH
jgi:hypothetical protein